MTQDAASIVKLIYREIMQAMRGTDQGHEENGIWVFLTDDITTEEFEAACFEATYGIISKLNSLSLLVPAGWQAVPKEPTEEMCKAGVWAIDKAREKDGLLQESRPYKAMEKHKIRYRAMLAAALKPGDQT